MINFEASNGNLILDKLHLFPKMRIQDLLSQKNIEIKPNIKNQLFESYIISNLENDRYAVSIYFYNNLIDFVSLSMGNKYNFPAFVITTLEKEMLNDILKNLKGANEYNWGTVSMVEDLRGGMISIIIKYI